MYWHLLLTSEVDLKDTAQAQEQALNVLNKAKNDFMVALMNTNDHAQLVPVNPEKANTSAEQKAYKKGNFCFSFSYFCTFHQYILCVQTFFFLDFRSFYFSLHLRNDYLDYNSRETCENLCGMQKGSSTSPNCCGPVRLNFPVNHNFFSFLFLQFFYCLFLSFYFFLSLLFSVSPSFFSQHLNPICNFFFKNDFFC